MYEDSALGLLLSGDFQVSLSGRQANVNEQVISSARVAAQEALTGAAGKPLAVLAFNCAGRRSKLKKYEDELAAIQDALGRDLPFSVATARAKSARWTMRNRAPRRAAVVRAGM